MVERAPSVHAFVCTVFDRTGGPNLMPADVTGYPVEIPPNYEPSKNGMLPEINRSRCGHLANGVWEAIQLVT